MYHVVWASFNEKVLLMCESRDKLHQNQDYSVCVAAKANSTVNNVMKILLVSLY